MPDILKCEYCEKVICQYPFCNRCVKPVEIDQFNRAANYAVSRVGEGEKG